MKTTQPVATSVALGNAALGAELQIFPNTTNGLSTWIITALTFDFVTSAVAGNRQSVLSLQTGGAARVLRIPQNSNIPASTARRTSCYPGAVPGAGVGIDVTLPLPIPGIVLRPGWVLTTVTAALDAGDQYQNIVVSYVELYPTASEALSPPVGQLWTPGQSL